MNHEFDQETGEILASTSLRDAALLLVPSLAVENGHQVHLRYPLGSTSGVSFLDVEYIPSETVCVELVETEQLPANTLAEATNPSYRGLKRSCTISLDSGEIDLYYEATGELDESWSFIDDEDTAGPLEPAPEPTNPQERILHAIWGTPPSEADAQLESLKWDLMMFTEEKLNVLFGRFVQLGVVEQ